ncbi:MAG: 50S ribosomal protein L3 [Clostridia bacterium]|nr:50S ribosomal protein L3 [Clostridia bacterium]MBR3564538.1 50S ribosomal protein L3 [Clostridia bacterium]MBR6822479.1 50S ribosomal protein L3 [Clostridia bacterium]
MLKAILGKKIGMTQIFTEEGAMIPVTVVEAGPCVVTQVKTEESDGYKAIQVGFGEVKEKLVNKPTMGQFKKTGIDAKKYLREFRTEEEFKIGDEIKVDVFEKGESIDVTAITKGKGYAGAIKRWGQHRGPMAHGSKYHRGQGSMGAKSDPGRVFKTKKMPGHLGSVQRTIINVKVAGVDADKNMLLIKGSVPGAKGQLLTIRKSARQ